MSKMEDLIERSFGAMCVVGAALAIAGAIAVVAFGFTGCQPDYSTGTRAGTIAKLSYKGIWWKCWTGQLVMGGVRPTGSGAVANTWDFSTTDGELAKKLQAAMDSGATVEIEYREWLRGPITLDQSHEALRIK